MIASVHGRLTDKTGDRVTVATPGGVSYELAVPIGVLERLPAVGSDVTLLTVPIVREDGWALFGFDEANDKGIFQRLLAASGVGPRLALAMLSTLGGGRVVRSIKEGDLATLCTVQGVGKKTAERIVLELKDRLGGLAVPGGTTADGTSAEQAVQALVNLGYSAPEADRAVREVVKDRSGTEAVDVIKQALKLLTRPK